MGNLLWGHYKEKIPLSLLSVQCIFTNAAICTWRQGSHTGWPELFKKDTEVQSAGNQSTEPFSFKFCAENIWPVNQYGRLLTWLQNWITKPTLEHLTPLTTWTAAQSKYSSLFERHSKCFLQALLLSYRFLFCRSDILIWSNCVTTTLVYGTAVETLWEEPYPTPLDKKHFQNLLVLIYLAVWLVLK